MLNLLCGARLLAVCCASASAWSSEQCIAMPCHAARPFPPYRIFPAPPRHPHPPVVRVRRAASVMSGQ